MPQLVCTLCLWTQPLLFEQGYERDSYSSQFVEAYGFGASLWVQVRGYRYLEEKPAVAHLPSSPL